MAGVVGPGCGLLQAWLGWGLGAIWPLGAGEALAGLRDRLVGTLVKVHSLPRAAQPMHGSP